MPQGFLGRDYVMRMSLPARLLACAGWDHCCVNETDGLVQDASLPLLMAIAGAGEMALREVELAGIFERAVGGFVIAEFLEVNRSHEERERAKASIRDKVGKHRAARAADAAAATSSDSPPEPVDQPADDPAEGPATAPSGPDVTGYVTGYVTGFVSAPEVEVESRDKDLTHPVSPSLSAGPSAWVVEISTAIEEVTGRPPSAKAIAFLERLEPAAPRLSPAAFAEKYRTTVARFTELRKRVPDASYLGQWAIEENARLADDGVTRSRQQWSDRPTTPTGPTPISDELARLSPVRTGHASAARTQEETA